MSRRPPAAPLPKPPSAARFLLAAVLIPIGLIAFALWLSAEYRANDQARAQLSQSFSRRLAVAETLSLLKDAETTQRGYVITGNRVFLDRFGPARAAINQRMAALAAAYRGMPQQRARLNTLDRLIAAKFAEMEIVLARRDDGGLAAAAARVSDNRGRMLMESARSTVSALQAEDARIMAADVLRVRARAWRIQTILWALVAVAGAGLAIGLLLGWRARQARYRLEAEAHESAARLHAIFDSTTDGIVLLNPSGTIETINPAVTRLLGRRPEEVVRRDVSLLLDIAGAEGTFADRIGLADGAIVQPIRVDRIAFHRNGTQVPVDVALGAMPLADGVHVVAAIRDVSERKAVERLKDQFVSTVSHELRTPLTSVIGALGLMKGGAAGVLPDQAARLVDIAENNSRRLIRLINDILDLDRLGAGEMQIERSLLDLAGPVREVAEGTGGLAQARQVRIMRNLPDEPVLVSGDRDRLVQVLTNLMSNAVRHTPAGGTVTIGLTVDGGRAIASVSDEGPGVAPELRERIFTRFAQAASGTPAGGSGLGLAISRGIMAAHDGELWFEDAPGGGARFCCAIPLTPAAIATPQETAGPPRLLLCEDDADAATIIAEMIGREGCEVDIVGTIAAAQDAVRLRRYDALMLDLHLPDGDGLSFARSVRRQRAMRDMPIVVLSGTRRSQAGDMGEPAVEVIDWIDKPVDPTRLADAVRVAIKRSRVLRPNILHVDDDADMVEVTAAALAGEGHMLRAGSLAAARRAIAHGLPDIVILDLGLPDGSGVDLLPDLTARDGGPIPTIIYSAQDVSPEIGAQVDAVLIKSRRSIAGLTKTIQTILARRGRGNDDG